MLVLSCYKFIFDCKDTTFFSNFHSPFWSFFILHLQITTIFRIFAVFFQSVKFKQAHTEKADNCLLSGKRGCRRPLLSDKQYSCPRCIFHAYTLIRGTREIHTQTSAFSCFWIVTQNFLHFVYSDKQALANAIFQYVISIPCERTRQGDRFSATKLQLFFEICKFSVQIFAEKNKKVENLCKRQDYT